MANNIILKASDLDGFLEKEDKTQIKNMNSIYTKAIESFKVLSATESIVKRKSAEAELIQYYSEMGVLMQEITAEEERINVYSFSTPIEMHAEPSRIIAKLRDPRTQHSEFVYYIQRAYEMLFSLAYNKINVPEKNYLITRTPVSLPVQNYGVHKIPDVDSAVDNSVMCVMLRGALLPSMIF